LIKHLALAIAAVLVLALVAPVFAQPFADVPADHWAFDAIAELAAKGILEGYPDGTFKGDRAMTRYEMAMALARILARIEAIKIPPPVKIPPPPPPEVRRADIDRLTRLLNEFRAELAALGVRVTAVEEELAALARRLDNTFITGDWTYVYTASSFPAVARNRARLTFRGRVRPDFTVFLRARWNSTWPDVSCPITDDALFLCVDFDRLLADYVSPWGVTFRVGRDYWTLGDIGLLLLGLASREGLRATGTFGPLSLTALGFFTQSGSVANTNYGLRAQMAPIAGWTVGANYRARRDYLSPASSTLNGTGWSVDWTGPIIPGLTFSGEYASWTPATTGCPPPGVTPGVRYGCSALFANLEFKAPLIPPQFMPVLNLWYKDYRAMYITAFTNTFSLSGFWWGGSPRLVTGWGADLTLQLTPRLRAILGHESGRTNASSSGFAPGQGYTSFNAEARYALSMNTTLGVQYFVITNTTLALTDRAWASFVTFRW